MRTIHSIQKMRKWCHNEIEILSLQRNLRDNLTPNK